MLKHLKILTTQHTISVKGNNITETVVTPTPALIDEEYAIFDTAGAVDGVSTSKARICFGQGANNFANSFSPSQLTSAHALLELFDQDSALAASKTVRVDNSLFGIYLVVEPNTDASADLTSNPPSFAANDIPSQLSYQIHTDQFTSGLARISLFGVLDGGIGVGVLSINANEGVSVAPWYNRRATGWEYHGNGKLVLNMPFTLTTYATGKKYDSTTHTIVDA